MVESKLSHKPSQQCELCGELSNTQLYLTMNGDIPICYLICNVCEVEFLTKKEININAVIKKIEVRHGNIFN